MPDAERRLRQIADLLGLPMDDLYRPAAPPPARAPRLLNESANGDRWTLTRDGAGNPVVRHLANAASGGHVTECGLGAFLARDPGSPQHAALLRLVGGLVTAFLADPFAADP